ncbi:MAG: hypothetical protein J7M24_01435 [Candidatus Latescibacteria bacterium]|nr:hypothetical protein [Candidatus Latescibacterota bacterium]
MKKRNLLLILLALVALSVISWDYTSGHTLKDIGNPEYCPICDAFQSVVIGVLLVYIIVLLGFVPTLYYVINETVSFVSSLFAISITPDRAPPASL